jgi:hypothetical protein
MSQPDVTTTTKVLPDHDPADWRDCSLCRHYIEAQAADPSWAVDEDLPARAKHEQFWNHTAHGRSGQLLAALFYVQYQRGVEPGHYPKTPSGMQQLARDLCTAPLKRLLIPGLRPWLPAMLLTLDRGTPLTCDETEFIFGDPPPPPDAVRARLAALK